MPEKNLLSAVASVMATAGIIENKSRPELVFGLVGPLGVDLDQIYESPKQIPECCKV